MVAGWSTVGDRSGFDFLLTSPRPGGEPSPIKALQAV